MNLGVLLLGTVAKIAALALPAAHGPGPREVCGHTGNLALNAVDDRGAVDLVGDDLADETGLGAGNAALDGDSHRERL